MITVVGENLSLIIILSAPYTNVKSKAVGYGQRRLSLEVPPLIGYIIDVKVGFRRMSAQHFDKCRPICLTPQRDLESRDSLHARLIDGRASGEKQQQSPHGRKLPS